RSMTILVVASPCAVVISIPAAILSAIAGAARNGILFKGGTHLEAAAELKAIAFDKTGTLTAGRPRLTDLIPALPGGETALLSIAATGESLSEHPVARAILEAAEQQAIEFDRADAYEALLGRGLVARFGDQEVLIGTTRLFEDRKIPIPKTLLE